MHCRISLLLSELLNSIQNILWVPLGLANEKIVSSQNTKTINKKIKTYLHRPWVWVALYRFILDTGGFYQSLSL